MKKNGVRNYETFVPLYISNYCDSYCKVCNLRKDNFSIHRIRASKAKIKEQLSVLYFCEKISAVCFLSGEYLHDKTRVENLKLIIWCIKTAFEMGFKKVYFNIGALNDNEIKMFSEEFTQNRNIVLSLFQEVYNNELYRKYFGDRSIENPKANYQLRKSTPERWVHAGFQQVDIGILLGITNPQKEVAELIQHANELYKLGATVNISLPRLRGIESIPYVVSDKEFKNIIRQINIECPWAKIIVTTREKMEVIKDVINEIDIISPGSSDVVPYTRKGKISNSNESSQFVIELKRERPSTILNALNKRIKYYQDD